MGSLFSGIGGFDLGFEQAGFRIAWQVEKDDYCRGILARHWQKVPRHEEVKSFHAGEWELVDVMCAGFPCQDLSWAGKRRGLAGEASGLFWEAVRIFAEGKPAWVVLENVPGLLSSNKGRDFSRLLETLEGLGYNLAWATLDSAWFGLAQRRKRVFIVGCLGRGCPGAVLAPPTTGSISAEAKAGNRQLACTLTRFYSLSASERMSAGFVPNGSYIRACPDPEGVREVAGLPRGLDTYRYAALGNAVSVPVAKWIAEGIMRCEMTGVCE